MYMTMKVCEARVEMRTVRVTRTERNRKIENERTSRKGKKK